MKSHVDLNENELPDGRKRLAPLFETVIERPVMEDSMWRPEGNGAGETDFYQGVFRRGRGTASGLCVRVPVLPEKDGGRHSCVGRPMDECCVSGFFGAVQTVGEKMEADFIEVSCLPAMTRLLLRYGYVRACRQLRLDLEEKEDDYF